MGNEKTFKLSWADGNTTILYGTCIGEAFKSAGYGAGAFRLLVDWEEVKEEKVVGVDG